MRKYGCAKQRDVISIATPTHVFGGGVRHIHGLVFLVLPQLLKERKQNVDGFNSANTYGTYSQSRI
jgi:hypothetical protein